MGSSPAPVVTRFAPSPTGFLHIGGARTALFNWVFARSQGGQFLLRIEDTDQKRSTSEAVDAILEGMRWLGLDWDGEAQSQYARRDRHADVAHQMVKAGHAYFCYASQEELKAEREAAQAAGKPWRYDGRWRDRDPSEAPAGVDPVVRLKAPRTGETIIEDRVQGTVKVPNAELDDMILLRSDGSPTYMLSVVVDDHDMGVTHIIRGDDHLTNAFRQQQIYLAMGWEVPDFAHIPLIHGPDGKKLSKRHGALAIDAYREMGYLPEAMDNYLMRLGWGHGDHELFTMDQAKQWFTLEAIGKGAARFDFKKLENFNGHYIRQADPARLCALCLPLIEASLGRALSEAENKRLRQAMPGLQERAKLIPELADNALFYFRERPLTLDEKAKTQINPDSQALLAGVIETLKAAPDWQADALHETVAAFAEAQESKLGKIAQPMRAALTGSTISPSIFDVMVVLGRDETLGRLTDQTA